MRIHPLTDEGKTTSKVKLSTLKAADNVRRETAQAKNDLESYILKVSYTIYCDGFIVGNKSVRVSNSRFTF